MGILARWRPQPAAQDVARSGFAVLYVDTTGPLPDRDRIVEIAVVRIDVHGQLVDEWTTLIDPQGPTGPSHLHGIAAAEVAGAPRFADVVGDLTARLAGQVIVAHHADYQLAFLQAEYVRSGWVLPPVPRLCTLTTSRDYQPALARRRLADCCWAANIDQPESHSALGQARSTAALFAAYRKAGASRDYEDLPELAAAAAWPPVPVSARPAVFRAAPSRLAGAAGELAGLLDELRLESAVEEGAPARSVTYLDLLAELLEDGLLEDHDPADLIELGRHYGLTAAAVAAAHRGLLLALTFRSIEDGSANRAGLVAAAATVGLAEQVVVSVLDAAQAASAAQLTRPSLPLPPTWTGGEPLRVGQAVAVRGLDGRTRAELIGRAAAAGLRVGDISRATVVLATDSDQDEREPGPRVVSSVEFANLLDHIQPAAPDPVAPQRSRAKVDWWQQAYPADIPSVTPAAVRRWARRNGYPVGVRGRMTADAQEAYLRSLVEGPGPSLPGWSTN